MTQTTGDDTDNDDRDDNTDNNADINTGNNAAVLTMDDDADDDAWEVKKMIGLSSNAPATTLPYGAKPPRPRACAREGKLSQHTSRCDCSHRRNE